jgi:acetoin utilization protein AcuB
VQAIDVKRVQILDALAGACGDWGAINVADAMTVAPDCVSAATTAFDLVRMFHAKNFRHLLVVDQAGCLQGVISDRDVLRCFGPDRRPSKKALAAICASQLMSTDVVTIGPHASLIEAVRLVLVHGIGCLPVMADDMLVGILTNTDLQIVLEVLLSGHGAAAPVGSIGRENVAT